MTDLPDPDVLEAMGRTMLIAGQRAADPPLMTEIIETPEADLANQIKRRLYPSQPGISVRVRRNRHYVTLPGEDAERPQSRCNSCGWELAARGYCRACGAAA